MAFEGLVQPGKRLTLALGAVEHADMLDPSGQGQAARRAVGETAIGDALANRSLRDQADDAQSFVGKHRRFQRPVDHQQIARRRGGDRAREQRYSDCCLHVRMFGRILHGSVRRHRMTKYRQPSVSAWQRTGECGDGGQRFEQIAVMRRIIRQTANQRARVSPVAGKIESNRQIAVASQGQREWQHQFLRSGEAMGDHHQRRRIFSLGAEQRYRRGTHPGPDHIQPAGGIREMPQPG